MQRAPCRRIAGLVALFVAATTLPRIARGDDPPSTQGRSEDENIAQALANPVASLYSFPVQNNFEFGAGPNASFRYLQNFQPVIPIAINHHWNMISRTIIPFVVQTRAQANGEAVAGLGDTLQSLFISPSSPTPFVWGLGPALQLPTATNALFGRGQWALGPTGVILKQFGMLTLGLLANHLWSVTGYATPSSTTLLQPIVSLTLPSATTFNIVVSEITFDWIAHEWTVPIGTGITQLLKLGGTPISLSAMGQYIWSQAANAPDWNLRLVVTFVAPRAAPHPTAPAAQAH